jgi:putative methionine-R-sulfoxide reductase with GAF domain
MDRSTLRFPDPVPALPHGERRHSIRQKLHSPVYASFNGSQTGAVVDLSELLDLHEGGFSVQTSGQLETNRALTVCLDLPETKNFIHGNGRVVWSDDSGRGGIQLSGLTESSRRILKEWLFVNLLIGCSHHQARSRQLERSRQVKSFELATVRSSRDYRGAENATDEFAKDESVTDDFRVSKYLADLAGCPHVNVTPSSLEAVDAEVAELGDDVDAILQLISHRACSLTGATGAAVAFLTDNNMTWRASAGEPVPPAGVAVNPAQGLSGECIRTGNLVSCEDMGNDRRVDPELSRALGIGSLMAAPILCDAQVVGLLEVLSPRPRSFTEHDAAILHHLAETISAVHPLKAAPNELAVNDSATIELISINVPNEALHDPESDVGEFDVAASSSHRPLEEIIAEVSERAEVQEAVESAEPASRSRVPIGLLGMAVLVVAIAVGYLVAPIIERHWTSLPHASQETPVDEKLLGKSAIDHNANTMRLENLRELADRGDVNSQWQLAIRYRHGDGMPQDDAMAVQWFERAAEQGSVAAQGALGAYYWRGWRGAPEDLPRAYFWSTIAMTQGDEVSKSRIEALTSRMTPAQVSTSRQQAEAWLRTHTQH